MAKVRVPNAAQQAQAMKQARFTSMSRLSKAMQKEFTLQSLFKLGYRNKEDISNLPPYVLVVGSQNVLTNAAEQITVRNGMVLDGAAGDQDTYGIDSNYDFNTHSNAGIQNTRKWGTNLEVRYENPATEDVSWINILSTLIATNVCNFAQFWDTSKNVALFVNGDDKVYRWTGGVGSFASATTDTITLSGTGKLSDYNFDSEGFLVIDGVKYSYTGAGSTVTQPYTQNPTDDTVTIDNSHYVSQSFTTGADAVEITTVTLEIKVDSTNLTGLPVISAFLCDNNAGVPGTLLGGASGSTSDKASGNYTVTFNFNRGVTPNTVYHLAFNLNWPPTNGGLWTISTYIGASGSVGTHIATEAFGGGFPTVWNNSNGYLNMTVNENDVSGLTFTGVTPDPTSVTIAVGDAVIQAPTIGTTKVTGAPLPTFDLIGNLANQIYYGSLTYNTVYITKVNNFSDASFSTPRLPGEGAYATLDAAPVAFAPQDSDMLVSAGRDFWYESIFTLSADLANESFTFARLKTTSNQGAQSQALTNKMKNNVIFVSYEPIFNTLGTTKDFLNSPQTTNLSDPIRNDMDAYDFTGGSVYYFNYYLYFTVPTMGVVRLYNLQKKYWEAPQIMPIGRFYQVDGVLYGHSYLTNESYQVFVPDVYNDNGNPIQTIAAFPYVSVEGAQPNQQKFFNRLYTEGYIAGNTSLTVTVNYDFGGFSGSYSGQIVGSNPKIIFNKITDGSLGQNTLGSQPIGAILNLPNNNPVPKFRIINTFPPVNNYEYQIVYSSYDVDANWALLRFGPAVKAATDMPTSISQ